MFTNGCQQACGYVESRKWHPQEETDPFGQNNASNFRAGVVWMEMNSPFGVFPVFVIGLVVVVVIVGIIVSVMADSKRRQALAAIAFERGWDYNHDDPFDIPSTYEVFSCLNEGHDREASNVISGEYEGLAFKAFDYEYKTGSGKDEHTNSFSAVIVQAPYPLKPISIRPEGFMDRVAGALGFDDIDFEWNEFNRAFYVKAADKQFAYDVIHQKMMEFLMENRGWCQEIFADQMIVSDDSDFAPEKFLGALQFARTFLGLLPDYLADKLRAQ